MQRRIARNNSTTIAPWFCCSNQTGTDRISQDVETDPGKGIALPFRLPQDMVMRLMLKVMRKQHRAEMFTHELHAVALIRVLAQAHPEQMNMIGHQTVTWTEQSLTRSSMQHYFTKTRVEDLIEPTGAAVGNGYCPVNDSVALIVFASQAGKIEAPVCAAAGEGILAGSGSRGHSRRIERTDVRCDIFCSIERQFDHC